MLGCLWSLFVMSAAIMVMIVISPTVTILLVIGIIAFYLWIKKGPD